MTLKSSANLVGLEKVVGDVAQVCIQSLFLMSASAPWNPQGTQRLGRKAVVTAVRHGFVIFSVIVATLNGCLSIALIVTLQECRPGK